MPSTFDLVRAGVVQVLAFEHEREAWLLAQPGMRSLRIVSCAGAPPLQSFFMTS